MADTRYLKRRHETWFFSLAVPRELRAKAGKDRIVASLKTRDLTVAQERRWGKLVEAQEAFAKLAGKTPAATKTLAPDALVQIDDFARTTYRLTLAQMAVDDRNGIPWEKRELDRGWQEAFSGFVIETDFKPIAKALAAYCGEHAIEPGTLHYQIVGDALLSARMHALKGRANALEGKHSDEPTTFLLNRPIDPITLRPLRSVGRGGLIFADVAARFIAEKQRDPAYKLTEQTKGQYEAAFRLFDQWARQPKLDDVDRRKASDFLDAIASLDPHWGRGPGVKKLSFSEIAKRFGGGDRQLSAKTINRYAMALGMVWQYAEDRDGYAGANPWTRQSRPTAKRRGNSELEKRGFDETELAKLLELQPSATPSKEVPAVLPWLTLIGAYSGMRLNEICELSVDDISGTGGIWHFDLKAAKTDAGVRVVPVHSKILAAGLLEYRNAVGKGPLWPGLKPGGPDGKRSWYVSKRFTEYRRSLGIVDLDKITGRDRLDYHSLRRSAVTALKRAGVAEHDVAEVVGHEHPRATFGIYPDRQKLERLKAIVEAIQYNC